MNGERVLHASLAYKFTCFMKTQCIKWMEYNGVVLMNFVCKIPIKRVCLLVWWEEWGVVGEYLASIWFGEGEFFANILFFHESHISRLAVHVECEIFNFASAFVGYKCVCGIYNFWTCHTQFISSFSITLTHHLHCIVVECVFFLHHKSCECNKVLIARSIYTEYQNNTKRHT